jgi:hypothetical protein
MKRYFTRAYQLCKSLARDPRLFAQVLNAVPAVCDASHFAQSYPENSHQEIEPAPSPANPLWEYFQNHREGRGIWKFHHYFDVYHRHFARFVGQKVDILEVGIYSGGSLEMWRSYFGEKSHIYGVDIEPACKTYANDHTSVFIGSQGDRAFWRKLKQNVEGIDILIDDGSHLAEQQQTTLEEMLPHLRPGGVYLCEDVCNFNTFTAFAAGLVQELNRQTYIPDTVHDCSLSPFQAAVHSIHFYPYLVVIEKHRMPPAKFSLRKQGTEWQPFL